MKDYVWALLSLVMAATPGYAGDVYLAVGPGGQRMLAGDGLSWENHVAWGEPKHDQNDLNVANFFKGAAYVGGGYSIARLTATRDGKTWSEGALPKGSPIFGLEVLNDHLYAVTLRGQVYKTSDGQSWTLVAAAEMPTKTHWIRATASGNGLIIGSGDYGPVLVFNPKTEKISITQMAGQKDKNAGLKRVAFGNGVFVVGGQDGLLAMTRDGIAWENNQVHAERGDIKSVVWTGSEFLASTDKLGTWTSNDGLEWKHAQRQVPRMLVRAGSWIYGWSWPPTKLERSQDGQKWESVPNTREFHVKHVAVGDLAGSGPPPPIPAGK